MVAPGSRSSTTAATMAVVVDPDRPTPCSSTTKTRSASPSKANPMSAPAATTLARRSAWFSGWIGSAGWLGKVPSSSAYITSRSNGSPSNTAGTTNPPMPLAVSATTLSGCRAETSTKERTWSANSLSRFRCEREPGSVLAGGIPPATMALMRSRPVSCPTGRAPGRQNLMPL